MGPSEDIDATEGRTDDGVMPKAVQLKIRVNNQQKQRWDAMIEAHNITHQNAGEAVAEFVLEMPPTVRAMVMRQIPHTPELLAELAKYTREWRDRPLPTGVGLPPAKPEYTGTVIRKRGSQSSGTAGSSAPAATPKKT